MADRGPAVACGESGSRAVLGPPHTCLSGGLEALTSAIQAGGPRALQIFSTHIQSLEGGMSLTCLEKVLFLVICLEEWFWLVSRGQHALPEQVSLILSRESDLSFLPSAPPEFLLPKRSQVCMLHCPVYSQKVLVGRMTASSPETSAWDT